MKEAPDRISEQAAQPHAQHVGGRNGVELGGDVVKPDIIGQQREPDLHLTQHGLQPVGLLPFSPRQMLGNGGHRMRMRGALLQHEQPINERRCQRSQLYVAIRNARRAGENQPRIVRAYRFTRHSRTGLAPRPGDSGGAAVDRRDRWPTAARRKCQCPYSDLTPQFRSTPPREQPAGENSKLATIRKLAARSRPTQLPPHPPASERKTRSWHDRHFR